MATTAFLYKYQKFSPFDIAKDQSLPGAYRVHYEPAFYHGVVMEFFPLGISIVVPNLHRWLDRGHFRSPTIFRENAVTKQEWEYIMERDGVSEDEATEYLFAEKDRVYKLLKKKYKRKDDSFEPTQKYDIKDYDKVWKLLKEQRRKHTWWGKLLGL